ncbi:RAMP superfamily CRISPR-associated protein [Roseospira navarrensis]|uniref:CRISPR type III-associated protein domain-containing protein n=1 Tax=Roseospira navarrensis TaxID=140058 RepID=A0A7X1ZGY5_9PROT|nr:RAMP superfamily CRISPR-associated protein [Roseospira navarrensis]MQX38172.1 hypothetical protein [Roseospira navarrensis]
MSETTQNAARVRRWRIEGTLTTRTPLHIGTGRFEARSELKHGREDDPQSVTEAKAKAVLLDADERLCVTATGLKGAMLAWAETHLERSAVNDVLFGCGPGKGGDGVGGRLEFQTARLETPEPESAGGSETPFRNRVRHTDLDTGVRINRASGTALDRHLFYKEAVAPGAVLRVVLDLDVPEKSADGGWALVARTLALLNAFNVNDEDTVPPLTLGAMTGRGFGRFKWTLDALSWATDDTVRAWIADGAPDTWAQALKQVPSQTRTDLETQADELLDRPRVPSALICDVTLAFDYRFLISEPGRVVKEVTSGIMPKVDAKGHAVLPTASLKGALRSRAERIFATLTGDETPFDHAPGRGRAGVDDPAAVMMTSALPTERLFGAASWRAALDVDPFEPVKGHTTPSTQELVAVDRFTGGASGSAKYAIDAFDRPTFRGRLRLDLTRCRPEDVGLLVLLLRDLAEGDVTFGYGSTKGYGGVAATVTVRMQGDPPETWTLPWPSTLDGAGGKSPLVWADLPDSILDAPLRAAVAALRDRHCNEEAA